MLTNRKVIIVGGGLTGLSAAIEALENGMQVVLIEKESKLGGNSAKASSGLNATPTKAQKEKKINDSIESFYQDTIKSGKGHSDEKLVRRLVEDSSSSIDFIEETGLEMSILSHLGGQTHPRTLRAKTARPSNVGLMIMNAFEQKMKKIVEKEPERLKIYTKTLVKEFLINNESVNGVIISNQDGEEKNEGDAVILATGGFSSSKSLLEKYAPSISHLPSTNGEWATGDGIYLAEKVGAQLKLMKEVQVHPTGIIDPNDPTNPTKILAGEALRGNGAMLICNGNRFVNEMGYRDFVTQKIFENCQKLKVSEEQSKKGDIPVVSFMILNQEAADLFEEAIKFYTFKKLVKKYENAKSFADQNPDYISYDNLLKTFNDWNNFKKEDGKGDNFKRPSYEVSYNENQPLYVIMVTPSVHYTMGGVVIDENARVLNNQNVPIKGLYAGGEITGGLHGLNRLGGNSLLECIVFGRIAVKSIINKK